MNASTGSAVPVFDIAAEPPARGSTVLLEASAGTGKTWTIAALVARYVVEGRASLEEMLVVTFGRAASQELRERVRDRLVEVAEALAVPTVYVGDDALLTLVVPDDPDEREQRLRRVRAALTDFDSAAIVTIHQFCRTVLKGLGIAGDTDAGAELVEELDDLLVEVVDDLYLRDHATPVAAEAFPRAQALQLARRSVADPRARLAPSGGTTTGSADAARVEFCEAVRREIDVRKRRRGVLSYDDLLGQLADALKAEDSPARTRMRQRWSLVLVDEFQDTDPVQWQVFERAFTGPGSTATMVLIGDPKQAIYAFRGGDVFTYLAAKRIADVRQTLGVNRRSDDGLLRSLQVVLQGAELGDPEILVHPVCSSHAEARLTGDGRAAFELRALVRDDLDEVAHKLARIGPTNQRIAADVAGQVTGLVGGPARYEGRAMTAGDIAVLAPTRRHLALVQRALADVGVPAVISGGGSVFTTPAATEWLTLLQALERPSSSGRVRAAGLTDFFGCTATELAAADERLTERLATQVRDWLDLFEQRGVAAVFETAVAREGVEARVLAREGGERHLTDLRHIAEVLHELATRERLGVVALLAWMGERMAEEVKETATERTRRLDSDAHAVQLLTIHGSKGLEFPVVLVPFGSDRYVGGSPPEVLAYHDDHGERVVHVGGADERDRGLDRRARREDDGESLRLLYVALTRARCRVIAWWAATNNAPASPLHRLLFGRERAEAGCAGDVPVPADAEAVATLRRWAAAEDGPALARADVPTSAAPASPGEPATLSARVFDRVVDTSWRRTSYSALSAAATHETALPGVGSEPEVVPREDEEVGPEAAPLATPPWEAAPEGGWPVSPMAALPVGAGFGSLVHAVLEHADPAAPEHGGDLSAELRTVLEDQLVWWPQDLDHGTLVDALTAVLDTPLGPLAAETTLRDIGVEDRLCELDFEMPLGGGDVPSRRVPHGRTASGPPHPDGPPRLADLAPLLRAHLPEGDPVRRYADALDTPALGQQSLRGYLTGSVDVVLRVDDRFIVVDYKTNWLGPRDAELTAAAYVPAALDAAMGHSDYPLQALLYAVVLHRFLRWRLPGYDPASHLGGVLYLYLRGMCGPDQPRVDGHPCGVFSWRPPVRLVEAASDLLDGAVPGRCAPAPAAEGAR